MKPMILGIDVAKEKVIITSAYRISLDQYGGEDTIAIMLTLPVNNSGLQHDYPSVPYC